MRYPALLAALLLATLPSARAELVEIHWSADGRYTHRGLVAPGKFVELCGRLPAGLKVDWEFEAGAPVNFNVHHHAGKDVLYPSKLTAVSRAADTLDAALDQDYCWMWTNKSAAPATLVVRLQR